MGHVLAALATLTTLLAGCGGGPTVPDRDRGLSESPLRLGVEAEPLVGRLLDGVLALRDGELQDAKTALEEHLNRNPRSSLAVYHLGLVALRQEHRAEARQLFEQAFALNPQLHGALSNLGVLYLADGEDVAAQKALEQAAILAPEDPRVWSNLGMARMRRGLWTESIEAWRTAAKLAPGHGSILYNLAIALMERAEYELALKSLDEALEVRPRFADAWAAKVACLQGLGRLAEAEQLGRQGLDELRPPTADNYVALARVLVVGRQTSEALDLLERAVAQFPENAGALLAYGELLDAKGEKATAVAIYQRFLKTPERRSDDARRIRDRVKQLATGKG